MSTALSDRFFQDVVARIKRMARQQKANQRLVFGDWHRRLQPEYLTTMKDQVPVEEFETPYNSDDDDDDTWDPGHEADGDSLASNNSGGSDNRSQGSTNHYDNDDHNGNESEHDQSDDDNDAAGGIDDVAVDLDFLGANPEAPQPPVDLFGEEMPVVAVANENNLGVGDKETDAPVLEDKDDNEFDLPNNEPVTGIFDDLFNVNGNPEPSVNTTVNNTIHSDQTWEVEQPEELHESEDTNDGPASRTRSAFVTTTEEAFGILQSDPELAYVMTTVVGEDGNLTNLATAQVLMHKGLKMFRKAGSNNYTT